MSPRESVPLPAARTPGAPPEEPITESLRGPPSLHASAAFSAEGPLLGRASAIAGGVGFGTLGIFGRLFYDAGGESFTLLVLRILGACVILVAIALLRRRPLPSGRDAALTMLLGLWMLASTFCLFAGYEVASPGLVTVLFYIYPLIVTVAAYAIFGEVLTRSRIALLAVGLAGIALTVGVPGAATAAGIGWGLAAGASVSVFILGARHMMSRSVDSVQFVALAYCGAVIALAGVAAGVGLSAPPKSAVGYGFSVIVLSTVLPTLLFYFAVRRTGAGPAARLSTIEPVTAVVLSYVVLGDALAASQIMGGALVVIAVILLATPPGALRRWYRRRLEPAPP